MSITLSYDRPLVSGRRYPELRISHHWLVLVLNTFLEVLHLLGELALGEVSRIGRVLIWGHSLVAGRNLLWAALGCQGCWAIFERTGKYLAWDGTKILFLFQVVCVLIETFPEVHLQVKLSALRIVNEPTFRFGKRLLIVLRNALWLWFFLGQVVHVGVIQIITRMVKWWDIQLRYVDKPGFFRHIKCPYVCFVNIWPKRLKVVFRAFPAILCWAISLPAI